MGVSACAFGSGSGGAADAGHRPAEPTMPSAEHVTPSPLPVVRSPSSSHARDPTANLGPGSAAATQAASASPTRREVAALAPRRPHDASPALFGAEALRVYVAQHEAGDEAQRSVGHGAVSVLRPSHVDTHPVQSRRDDPLVRALASGRERFLRHPVGGDGADADDTVGVELETDVERGVGSERKESSTPVSRPRHMFTDTAAGVSGSGTAVSASPSGTASPVVPGTARSAASTVVNPTTRRFLQRWAESNLATGERAGVGSHQDDDLDVADVSDDDLMFWPE